MIATSEYLNIPPRPLGVMHERFAARGLWQSAYVALMQHNDDVDILFTQAMRDVSMGLKAKKPGLRLIK